MNPIDPKTIILPLPADPDRILLTETFHVLAKPSSKEINQAMGMVAKFLNQLMGECLRSGSLSAGMPAASAIMNASMTLEQGIQQTMMMEAQQQAERQGGFVQPGGGGGRGPVGGGGGFRAN